MNTKAKGSRNERRSIKLLESLGYRCTKSGASLGEWDIIGIGCHDIQLVQVKTNSWPGSVEMERLELFPCPNNCVKAVWRWDDNARRPRVKIWFPDKNRWIE